MAQDREELQHKYLELQLIDQQIRQIQQQIGLLDAQIVEYNNNKAALEDLAKSKIGSATLMSISPGIFAKGELRDNKELLVNLGADVMVKKSIEETKDLLDKQIMEIKKTHEYLMQNLQELVVQAQAIQKELENVQVS